jgi:DNA helicase HerA-like ATPase
MTDHILIGLADSEQKLLLNRANRHGLVAGATGTGKTITLQILAQGFSDAGVPVFAADVKGDLSGIGAEGHPEGKLKEKLEARAKLMGLDMSGRASPVVLWDLWGQKGHPVRTTISEMGPLLLGRLLELNETQEGVLNIVFHMADKEGLLLLDLKDLRAMLTHVSENAKEISARYGQVSPTSIATIQRQLLSLESQGADQLFGEPILKLSDLMRIDANGRGMVNLLAGGKLIESPRLYATFLLWLMSELFEQLPEIGDPDKPKLVFFFDEAHLLFKEAPKPLLEKIEQVVRLIRSKGVGIYFVTQNPADIPDTVLAQLGNRIQHALRAYTPSEQKGLKAAAQSFRANPAFDTATTIQELGVGEAIVSTLDEKGTPTITAKTMIRPPVSRMGPLKEDEIQSLLTKSELASAYNETIDRLSAYETLMGRSEQAVDDPEPISEPAPAPKPSREEIAAQKQKERQAAATTKAVTKVATSVLATVGATLGRELLRGLLGGMKKRR